MKRTPEGGQISRNKRNIVWKLILLGALGGLTLRSLVGILSKPEEHISGSDTGDRSEESPRKSEKSTTHDKPTSQGLKKGANSSSEALQSAPSPDIEESSNSQDILPHSDLWFKPITTDAEGNITAPHSEPLPINWDSQCEKHPWRFHTDLNELVQEELGVKREKVLQRGLLALDHTVFWKEESDFFQLAFSWEQNDPPTYHVEGYRASDPLMSKDVEAFDTPQLEQRVRLSSASKWISQEILPFSDKTQQVETERRPGARVVRYRLSTPPQQPNESPEFVQVTLVNSTAVVLHGRSLNCQSGPSRRSALCLCQLEGE